MFPEDSNRRLWSTHFGPFRSESFSSWIIRLSANYRLTPKGLISQALGRSVATVADWDRFQNQEAIEAIALRTGIAPSKLRRATLGRYEGALFANMRRSAHLPFVRPASQGYQVCPRCLARLRNPHYRLSWRLQFVAVCAVHSDLLLDKCPRCACSIQPYPTRESSSEWAADRTGLCICRFCGLDLRTVRTQSMPYGLTKAAATAQQRLLHALEFGPDFLCAGNSSESLQYFKEALDELKGEVAELLGCRTGTVADLRQMPVYARAIALGRLPFRR